MIDSEQVLGLLGDFGYAGMLGAARVKGYVNEQPSAINAVPMPPFLRANSEIFEISK